MKLDVRGAGPVVLILHGMPQRPGSCWQLGRHLTDAYTVVVPSLPGYDESPPVRPYDFGEAEDRLVQALAERGIDTVHAIVGFSGGSYRALRLAAAGRLSPRAVALYGALGGPMSEEHRALFHQFADAVCSGAPLDDAAIAMAHPASVERDPSLKAELVGWLQAADAETFASELVAFTEVPRLTDAVRNLDLPVLVMVGEGDLNTPVDEARAVASALPDANLVVVPGARHALWWEAEQASVDALRALLERVRGPEPSAR